MAKNVFNPNQRYLVTLYAHSFLVPSLTWRQAQLPGKFEADTIELEEAYGNDTEFAVFHVDEPQHKEYPDVWVGVYRVPVNWLATCPPEEIDDDFMLDSL